MIFTTPPQSRSKLRLAIDAAYRMDETTCVNYLIEQAAFSATEQKRIFGRAKELTLNIRDRRLKQGGLDAFLMEYDLSSEEGVALMCVAEALLRIPDKKTIDKLIRDKVSQGDWDAHRGKSGSAFVNTATWALMLTGKILSGGEERTEIDNVGSAWGRFIGRSSEPMVRKAVGQAIKILSKQFVMGRNIPEALKRAKSNEKLGYRYSYDMLGEAARTAQDAENFFGAYQNAIADIGKAVDPKSELVARPGISIKLSALHPRYEYAQRERVLDELTPRLFALAKHAKEVGITLTIDAEEADRLDLSLDIIEAVFSDPALDGWEGFGLAVQSYQKRAWYVLDWLADLARKHKRHFMVRLIKGAYWDTEIKLAQEQGVDGYPVFTRKASTDVSFLACAKKILQHPDAFYPQFATHNAHTVSAILEMVGDDRNFEFQCLHGMGDSLYHNIVGKENLNLPCRIYAPVGNHDELLSYLVRRLLENGANSSFVNRIADAETPIETLLTDPVTKVKRFPEKPHPKIPLPQDLYGEERKNSQGLDLTRQEGLVELAAAMQKAEKQSWLAGPILNGKLLKEGEKHAVLSPNDRNVTVGHVYKANEEQVKAALEQADKAFLTWETTPVSERANCLRKAADLFEQHRAELMTLLIREAGKTLADALSEVREAVDFCRYYAQQAELLFGNALQMPGPTGEVNTVRLNSRGVVVCISPWNFPLAIFTGQMTAALAAGNTVVAKPSDQTTLIAALAVKLLHQAGIPNDVLQLMPGRSRVIGNVLVADPRVKGIVFTGSTNTARIINQTLAERPGAIVPFIAETGGQNAMIVDSSALPEQTIMDVVMSAFGSAGQRCSALRVLFIQDDVADKMIDMLKGAMQELHVGDSSLLATDVGPVIDTPSLESLQQHVEHMDKEATLLYQVPLSDDCKHGTFFAPRAYELKSLKQLPEEVFGPVLHVIRFKRDELDKVIDDIHATEFGLTLGIQSRVNQTVEYIQRRMRVGNIYVNRNMIGAVVGVQPFGGEGLSGTGPKAGGPHYLTRLATERTLTINTTASGGNATLMSLNDS